jgi:hypothetical protein
MTLLSLFLTSFAAQGGVELSGGRRSARLRGEAIMRREELIALALCVALGASCASPMPEAAGTTVGRGSVALLRAPGGGIQPQAAVDARGALHLIYFAGRPEAGDIFYVRREKGAESFSAPARVNSQPGSAIAVGTIRGAQLALGRDGRAHVAWMGSPEAAPRGPGGAAPMLYARSDDAGTGFEPQRNLMRFAAGLDGGGTVAADGRGRVYVAWHANGKQEGEAHRRVWVARSEDEGRSFAPEADAFAEETGACGCCGMRALADGGGTVNLLYRAATDEVNRDMFLLASKDYGRSFDGARLHPWRLDACPLSTAALAEGRGGVISAWETNGQIYFAAAGSAPTAAPGGGGGRKHPSVAVGARGDMLLVWTEGTGWQKGGSLAWQLYDGQGKPSGEKGTAPGVPVWGLATAVAGADGRFTIIY